MKLKADRAVLRRRAARRLREFETLRPGNAQELHHFVRVVLGLDVPRRALVEGNSAPFEYLVWAFFEGGEEEKAGDQESTKTRNKAPGVRLAPSGRLTDSPINRSSTPGATPGAEERSTLTPTLSLRRERGPGDSVVWASRGGGKTMLGAAATVLDLLFKPGIQVRILGGSLGQSSLMFRYLCELFARSTLAGVLADRPTQRRIVLPNGSAAEVLAQSQTSVRGTRVHKLRCDEVELFRADIWDAAQRVTRSQRLGGRWVHGTIEALSTMHRPFGLMAGLVEEESGEFRVQSSKFKVGEAEEAGSKAQGPKSNVDCLAPAAWRGSGRLVVRGAEEGEKDVQSPASSVQGPGVSGEGKMTGGRRVFRWCALDVAARCPEARACAECKIWPDCRGRARAARGFMPIADLVAQWQRSSTPAWDSEMMCRRPQRSDCVYATFDPTPGGRHVGERARAGHQESMKTGNQESRKERAGDEMRIDSINAGSGHSGLIIGGMDFGMRSPLVMLWARVGRKVERGKVRVESESSNAGLESAPLVAGSLGRWVPTSAATADLVVEVFGEYVGEGFTLEQNLDRIEALADERGWPRTAWVGVDPAGGQRNAHTGLSDTDVLRRRGYAVRARRSNILQGVERVRCRMDHQTLRLVPACAQLIRALTTYHFDADHPHRDRPVKDGPDHLCDALRYLIVNLDADYGPVKTRRY